MIGFVVERAIANAMTPTATAASEINPVASRTLARNAASKSSR
ncbi:MAG TPA: hypothetical protein VLX44_11885 [Xanthobacteraceae bacterium]|nr:hypothetical protein [Xanthobacteraceae bacterium]